MYIGESEKNVREVFQRARNARPCVLFFDELDSLAPARGKGSDSGGVMDRVVSQLLTELDGMQKSADVFVIGATNRPDLLDNALLRPGRFDKLIYLGISEDHEAQVKIIQALTRKFTLGPDVDLMEVAKTCTFNFTGADFYALCSDSMMEAIKEKIESIEKQAAALAEEDFYSTAPSARDLTRQLSSEEKRVVVEQRHFLRARAKLNPSVSFEELAHYKALQSSFANNGSK
eukprot:GILI01041969.1.p1 GENE.GILI01041969.1~~GILI01041969.1.p1  ORF type:complete len:231 (+),score=48.30 GILI01041969.1:2-694(+)